MFQLSNFHITDFHIKGWIFLKNGVRICYFPALEMLPDRGQKNAKARPARVREAGRARDSPRPGRGEHPRVLRPCRPRARRRVWPDELGQEADTPRAWRRQPRG